MPAMAAAYAVLAGPQVPRATSALNVVQRVGGSLGTALLAVVLQGHIRDAIGGGGQGQETLQRVPEAARQRVAEPLAQAFGQTFWWALGLVVIAFAVAVVLLPKEKPEPIDDPDDAADAAPVLMHA
jgi:Na+/alanine symporter